MSDKRSLREEYARIRAAARSEEKDGAIADRVLSLFGDRTSFFLYVSVRTEVATDALIRRLIRRGKRVCVPRIENGVMLAVPYAPLMAGAYGIPAPPSGEDTPCEVTLAPLLAFDDEGYRLGYGGGFYDAYFAAHPHTERVGLAYAAQRAVLPHEAWDIPLHAVVTEEGCLRPIERRALPVEDLC